LFAAVLLYTAYVLKDEVIEKGRIFELVAGEGNNYAATEAPALGVPGGVKFVDLPPAPTPTPPAPEPVAPAAPEPVSPAPVEAVPAPKVEPKPTPRPVEASPVVRSSDAKPAPKVETLPNPNRTFIRKIAAVANKQKVQHDREVKEAARQAALAAKTAEIAAKKAELLAQSKAGGAGQTKIAKIDAEGIAKGVLGGSTNNKTGGAGGTALSREEQDLLETYYALLDQRLREAHEKPPGLSDLLTTTVEFYLAANGSISRASILQPSGNTEFDRSVLAAINNVRTIGPRPDGKGSMIQRRFKMKDKD
jgi:colicin import membrane protein